MSGSQDSGTRSPRFHRLISLRVYVAMPSHLRCGPSRAPRPVPLRVSRIRDCERATGEASQVVEARMMSRQSTATRDFRAECSMRAPMTVRRGPGPRVGAGPSLLAVRGETFAEDLFNFRVKVAI